MAERGIKNKFLNLANNEERIPKELVHKKLSEEYTVPLDITISNLGELEMKMNEPIKVWQPQDFFDKLI